VSTDPHRPTPAGPDPAAGSVAAGPVAPEAADSPSSTAEPTPTVGASDASYSNPPGSAAPSGVDLDALSDRPEVLAGAAFAGGLVAAMILKRLGR
jgi:hypothetical protein